MGAWFDWTSLVVGIGGLVAGTFGLWFAFLAHRSAQLAERAATSAEDAAERASEETRRTVSRSRRTVDNGKAIFLINQLKALHRSGHWEYALELYPELRSGISDIQASLPEEFADLRNDLTDAIPRIRAIEDEVNLAGYERREPGNVPNMDGILNDIHQDLLRLLGTDIHGP